MKPVAEKDLTGKEPKADQNEKFQFPIFEPPLIQQPDNNAAVPVQPAAEPVKFPDLDLREAPVAVNSNFPAQIEERKEEPELTN